MAKILKTISILFICSYSLLGMAASPIRIPLHAAKVSLDPSSIQDLSSLFVSRQINCQLIRSNGTIVTLEAAQSIRFLSPTRILITLKKDAVFHDGTHVTTYDIAASFSHLKRSRHVLRNVFNWIKSIEIVNSNSLIINLIKPMPQFLTVLSSPNYAIFKKSFLSKAINAPDSWKMPLGCGKYKVAESDASMIKLTPINHGRPVEFYLNSSDQINAEQITSYDIIDLHVSGHLKDNGLFKSVEIFDPTQIYLGLNTQIDRWKRKSDRCAFLAKLKTDNIIKQYNGRAKFASDLLPEGVLGYSSNKKQLDSIFKIYASRNLTESEPFCLAFLTVSVPKDLRRQYQRMIERIFPTVLTKEALSNKQFGRDFINSKCDAMIAGIKSNTLDGYDMLAVMSSVPPNFTGLYDKKLMSDIEDSQSEANPAVRASLYRNIIDRIENSCSLYPVLSIPMKRIYIRNGISTPNIGKGPLNEYDLSEIS